MAKITYTNKVKIKDIPVAEVNKFTADNANEIKTIVNELDDIKDNIANKSQDVESDKLSIVKYPSVKALYDWAVGKFQSILVSGTNIKTINGDSILGSGNITISGGGGDMVLADAQTVSGLKTFLNGAFGLRNVANTFTSFFTNTNTASRTYTLQDKSGTLALTDDIINSVVVSNTTRIERTGSTGAITVLTLNIPANKIIEGGIYNLIAGTSRGATNASGIGSVRVYFDDEGTASIRGVNCTGANARTGIIRTILFRNGNKENFANSGGFFHDYQNIQNNILVPFDITTAHTLNVEINLSISTDICYLDYISLIRIT